MWFWGQVLATETAIAPSVSELLGADCGFPQPYFQLACNRKIAGRDTGTDAVSILLPMNVISLFFIFLIVSSIQPTLQLD